MVVSKEGKTSSEKMLLIVLTAGIVLMAGVSHQGSAKCDIQKEFKAEIAAMQKWGKEECDKRKTNQLTVLPPIFRHAVISEFDHFYKTSLMVGNQHVCIN